jgi:hypothetical protein
MDVEYSIGRSACRGTWVWFCRRSCRFTSPLRSGEKKKEGRKKEGGEEKIEKGKKMRVRGRFNKVRVEVRGYGFSVGHVRPGQIYQSF